MVIFRSAEGKAGYHQADGLEDAIRFVERLRNSENVEQARIFRMEEVSFEYRPYFRVEVGGGTPAHGPEADGGEPAQGHAEAPVEAADDAGADEVGLLRRNIFSR